MAYGSHFLRELYYRSPGFVRDFMATIYSLRENPRKFTPYMEACLHEIQETEHWPTERQETLQSARLQAMIGHAVQNVPYYRDLFREHGLQPSDIRDRAGLQKLPFLNKSIVVGQDRRIWAQGFMERNVSMRHTSGTTGAGLVFPIDWPGLQREYAYFWAHNAWGGIRRGERSATFAGHPVAGPDQTLPPFWALSWVDHELFFSSQHMTRRNLELHADRLRRFQPVMIHGYPSSLYVMALYLLEKGYADVRPRAVFTGSETLLDFQREMIAQAFGCRLLNWYGNSEMIGNIVECERGNMHIRELHSVLEILDPEGRSVGPGETGELVCTGLGNHALPMIRYRIGDTITLAAETTCPCGRGGRLVKEVLGRLEDIIITPDGRHVGRLDHIFKDLTNVAEAQIIQNSLEALTLRIVRRLGYNDRDTQRILDEARLRLGSSIRINIEFVEQIPRSKNGKFRFAISNLPLELRGGRQVSEVAPSELQRRFG